MEVWLILGATGTVGRTVVNAITERITPDDHLQIKLANHLRASQEFDGTENVRYERVPLELQERSSVESALTGVDKAVCIFPDGPAASQLKADFFHQAAKKSVKHIIYLSYRPPQLSEEILLKYGLTREHIESERALLDSGLRYTILRSGHFMQNMVNFYAVGLRNHNAIFLPTGDCQASHVDVRDLGEAIACILPNTSSFENQILVLTGTPPLSYSEMAEVFSRELNRKIKYLPFAGETLLSNLSQAYGMSVDVFEFLDDYLYALERYIAARQEVLMPASDDLMKVLGRQPRQFDTFVRDHATAFSPELGGADKVDAPIIVS